MRRDRSHDDERRSRPLRGARPRRPWALIAACLVLVALSTVLWVKWSGTRRDVARLQRELTHVYKEAEDLRLKEARAQESLGRIEREISAIRAERDLKARPADDKARGAKPPARR